MREKLIELLMQAKIGWTKAELADHLIANGVTIPTRCKDCTKEWCYLRQELGPEGFCSGGERNTN
jgi:predicted nucleic acid binding AN1-type Zn finger protein